MNTKKGSRIIRIVILSAFLPISAALSNSMIPEKENDFFNQLSTFDAYDETIQPCIDVDCTKAETSDFGFYGINYTGWTPPDPIIAAGPNHVVVMTNGAIGFFQKNGIKDFQDEIEDSYGFWGAQGATNFVFDPEVIYDPHANRFMALAAERAPGSLSYFLLAISDDTNPNGNWYKYRLDVTSLAGGDIDSPNIAVDSEVIYLSADFFTGGQKYLVYMLEKAPLLSGTVGVTRNMLITGSQSFGIPVTYGDALAMYMIEHFESASNTIVRLHAITDPLGIPQRVTYDLTVPAYSPPEDPPQKGTTARPNTFDSRFWSCVWRDGSLWATHHQGTARVMARWYEIKTNNWPTSGSPSLYQSGDIDPGPDIRTFFTAISPDGFGNAAMCFARSSPDEYISIARCTRLSTDPLGTMRDVVIVKNSTTSYNGGRWGDYSGVSCDPSDNRTFWMHGEYTPGGNIWNTWISCCTTPNTPPNVPSTPAGPDHGMTRRNYTFSTNTTDFEGDLIYYQFDWGDGNFSAWLGPYTSGELVIATYAWTDAGTFGIKVRAKDNYGESPWSTPHTITIVEGPQIEIGNVSGGVFKIRVLLKNTGATDAANVNWTMILDGGAVLGKKTIGSTTIPAGQAVTISSKLILGFGATIVTVTAQEPYGSSDEKQREGFVFLFFIHIKPSG